MKSSTLDISLLVYIVGCYTVYLPAVWKSYSSVLLCFNTIKLAEYEVIISGLLMRKLNHKNLGLSENLRSHGHLLCQPCLRQPCLLIVPRYKVN
jgi:hypothetical protein